LLVYRRLAASAAVLAFSGALALGGMVATPNLASAAPGASQFCKEEIRPFLQSAFELSITQGACVSALEAGNPTAAASSLCKDARVIDIVGADNHGKCTQEVKAFLEPFFGTP
jgi:hypothetical protein